MDIFGATDEIALQSTTQELDIRVLILGDKDFGKLSDEIPDSLGVWRVLRSQGIESDRWPASGLPLNPFAGGAMALRGLDPLRTLRVLFRQRRYSLIVCVFEGSALGPALLKRLGLLRRPLILWDFAAGTEWRLRMLFQRLIFPNVDGILCLNACQARIAEESFGAQGKSAFVGYDVDTDFFSPEFSCDGAYALAVGNDISRDYDTLMEAMRSSSVPLTVCSRLKLQPPADPSAKFVKLDGALSYERLRDLYGRSRFVILPLKDVPHPGGITTLVEAMSMGKAIICSDSAGIQDFLMPGENAIVVPPGDRAALQAAIQNLDADASERKRLGGNARRYAENMLAIPVVAERMKQALARFV